ncbi:unnamed protein product [Colias eurytheme]|nr:unnamed protein product [Colias eurytheme]
MEVISKLFALTLLSCVVYIQTDKPCAPKQFSQKESIVCVCNATYCDDFIRQAPEEGSYVTYTSSKDGMRFKKEVRNFQNDDEKNGGNCYDSLEIDPSTTFQTVEGFGSSVTDAAGINWESLDPALRYGMIKSYFSEEGLEYNMVRVPIGGSDFSTHPYAYNELPEDDINLTNYTLAPEDFQLKIPMLHQILNLSADAVHIVGTVWSPPPWMKTNDAYTGFSRLKREYYQTYAEYHMKFIEKYEAENIPIWAITTTNEPVNGVFNLATFNTLGWTAGELGNWILNYLGPTLRNSTFNKVKILTCDDQRYSIPFFFNILINEYPEAINYIDGIAVHYYGDKIIPASVLDIATRNHPDKFILATEACEGSMPWEEDVDLGSWGRANGYITDIMEDLNHHVVGWIDWNMCLNTQGGPNWVSNFVDSPIIISDDKQEFYKQPMFYAMGHFSKFIPRGSIRIEVTKNKSSCRKPIQHVAFLTPRNTTVVVLANRGNQRSVKVTCQGDTMFVNMNEHSITTIEFVTKKRSNENDSLDISDFVPDF